jgi:ribose-phosphate pyrophosphokinase
MSHLEPEAKIFACSQSVYLKKFRSIRNPLKLPSHYSDGEFQPSYEESIRGLRVFIVLLFQIQFDGIITYDRC